MKNTFLKYSFFGVIFILDVAQKKCTRLEASGYLINFVGRKETILSGSFSTFRGNYCHSDSN